MAEEYAEEDFLQLSGLQHFIYCRRQWALIHLEGQWKDNLWTVEGSWLHRRAHDPQQTERRGETLICRDLRIHSRRLGVSGACDVVEFQASPCGVALSGQAGTWKPVPVEYKRGRPKEHDADRLQLCAQAMCLEKMLACSIPVGFLYYGEPRRREKVELTADLRGRVEQALEEMHRLARRGYTPVVRPSAACRGCSLREECLPQAGNRSVERYLAEYLKEETT